MGSLSSERSSSSLDWSSITSSSESLKWEFGENSPSLRGDSFLPNPTGASELPARAEGEGEGEHIASSTMPENEPSSKGERKDIPLMWTGKPPPEAGTAARPLQTRDEEALSFPPSKATSGESTVSHVGELLSLSETSLVLPLETGPSSSSARALM